MTTVQHGLRNNRARGNRSSRSHVKERARRDSADRMMELKRLRHPVRSLRTAKAMAVMRCQMWKAAAEGSRRFGDDTRYNLGSVETGFLPSTLAFPDDSVLLERICDAYARATERRAPAPDPYGASPWWEEVRRQRLEPVRQALRSRQISTLQAMYRNFYRDPCSTGLIAVPYGMTDAYFGKTIPKLQRRYYLFEVLHRVDRWRSETGGRFPLSALAAPDVGNPFGAVIEGTRVEAAAPYRHYCAYKISGLLNAALPRVVEIGGGFGGTAYYLLRDRPQVHYCGFDVPESLALTAYYLMRALPHLSFALYGEEAEKAGIADVTLLPLFELPNAATQSADVTFSSHAMTDISRGSLAEYLTQVARITRHYFLHIGVDTASIPDAIKGRDDHFALMEQRRSGWNTHKPSGVADLECLYELRHTDRKQEPALSCGNHA